MFLLSLAFLCGVLFLQHFSFLPSLKWAVLTILAVVFLKLFYWRYTQWLAFFILGFTWSLLYATFILSHRLPPSLEGKTLVITGTVASIPNVEDHHRTCFLFRTSQYKIKLSWQDVPFLLHMGDQLQLSVRLKRIHGLENPGSSDHEAFSLAEGIDAQGYVINHSQAYRLASNNPYYFLGRIRQFIRDQLTLHLPPGIATTWIIALMVGVREGVTSNDWQVLRNTGTNHLIAIAGLHLGFISAMTYGLISRLWRRIPHFCLILPAQEAGSIATLIMAFIYSALAGFSIPTERAFIMLGLFLWMTLFRKKIFYFQILGLTLFALLFLNPLSVLTASFWMSFYCMAFILYVLNGQVNPHRFWWQHGRIQWLLAVGLIPFNIWFFQECSLISIVANAIAIPAIGFLILPLIFFSILIVLFSKTIGFFMLTGVGYLIQCLWHILTFLSHFPFAAFYYSIPTIPILLLTTIGILILLVPNGIRGRWLGAFWLLPCFYYPEHPIALGELRFTLLDVGQGLSTVIQTQKHVLVFDTGAKLSDQYDMGNNVVLPFLRSEGIRKIDMLVISHGDNDHSGGAAALMQQIPITTIKSSVLPSQYCLAGTSWVWDQVTFTFLYPDRSQLGLGNNSSCVLQIKNRSQTILLTGDIEKSAEYYLLKQKENLSATILVAPHHGSKTSALDEFIDQVNPKIVLFAVGYRNQYHLPSVSVIKKYQDRHILQYDSVKMGAIQFDLKNGKTLIPHLYRLEHQKYWTTVV